MSQKMLNIQGQSSQHYTLSQSIKHRLQAVKFQKIPNTQIYDNKNQLMYIRENKKKNIYNIPESYSKQQILYIEPNMKKNKYYQNDKLNQLKKQYHHLYNIQIQDSLVYYHKNQNGSQEFSENSQDKQQSVNSEKSYRYKKQEVVEYQKKQLETMLTNNMNRVEELIKSQMEYKKKLYQLTHSNTNANTKEKNNEEEVKKYQKKIQEYQNIVNLMKQEDKQIRKNNTNLSERVKNMENQIFQFQAHIKKIYDQKKRLEDLLFCEKQGHMSIQIQMKKVQLQKDILQKEKNNQIQRLNKQINELTVESQHQSSRIKQLQSELQQISREISQKSIRQQQKSREIQKERQKEKQKEKKNKYLQKIQQNKLEQQQIKSQIGYLKKQIENYNQNMQIKKDLQKKICMLENIINDDNKQKIKFFQEINRFIKDFQTLQKQNDSLKTKLKKQQNPQTQQISPQQSPQKASKTLPQAQNQPNPNQLKLKKLQIQNKNYQYKISQLQDRMINMQQIAQKTMQEYEKKLQQSQYQLQKLRKQNQFNTSLSNHKYQSQIQFNKSQLSRLYIQKNEQIKKYQDINILFQNKLSSIEKQYDHTLNHFNQKLKNKEQEIYQLKNIVVENNAKMRKQFQMEMLVVVNRLEEVAKSNERYAKENQRLINCESQMHDLRQRAKRLGGINEGVDHLWQVKQTEYCNINYLLQQMRC